MEFCDTRTGADMRRSDDEARLKWCDRVSKWFDTHGVKRLLFSNVAETSGFYSAHIVSDRGFHLKRWCSLARDTQRRSFGMCASASRASLFSLGILMHWWRMLRERSNLRCETIAGAKPVAGAMPLIFMALILLLLVGIFVPAVGGPNFLQGDIGTDRLSWRDRQIVQEEFLFC